MPEKKRTGLAHLVSEQSLAEGIPSARPADSASPDTAKFSLAFDAEMYTAGVQLGGYYAERGVVAYKAWSDAIVADFGEGIRPYLKAIYLGIQNLEEFDKLGMQSKEEVEATSRGASKKESPINAKPPMRPTVSAPPKSQEQKEFDRVSSLLAGAVALEWPELENPPFWELQRIAERWGTFGLFIKDKENPEEELRTWLDQDYYGLADIALREHPESVRHWAAWKPSGNPDDPDSDPMFQWRLEAVEEMWSLDGHTE